MHKLYKPDADTVHADELCGETPQVQLADRWVATTLAENFDSNVCFGPFAEGDQLDMDHSLCDKSMYGGNTPSTNVVYESLQRKKPLSSFKSLQIAKQTDTQPRNLRLAHPKPRMSPKCVGSYQSVFAGRQQPKEEPILKEVRSSPTLISPTLTLPGRCNNTLSVSANFVQLSLRGSTVNKTIKHSGFKRYLPSDNIGIENPKCSLRTSFNLNKSEEKETSPKAFAWPRLPVDQEEDVTPRFNSKGQPQEEDCEPCCDSIGTGDLVSDSEKTAIPETVHLSERTSHIFHNPFKTELLASQMQEHYTFEQTSIETLRKASGIRIETRLTSARQLQVTTSRFEHRS